MDTGLCFNYYTVFVIKIPSTRVLRLVSRSLLIAMGLAMLYTVGSTLKGSVVFGFDATPIASGSISDEELNLILHDLGEKGLLKNVHKALIMGTPSGLVMDFDEPYDFVFAHSFEEAVFADSILKVNGIVAFPLSFEHSNVGFIKRSNYRVVYLKKYGSTVVALRKIGLVNNLVDSSSKRKLFQLGTQARTRALKGLEDVLLEPPNDKSNKNSKIKYLPVLLDDSLEGYKRGVFISVGSPEENNDAVEWFDWNYPKKNAKFRIQSLVIAPESSVAPPMDVSAWLSKHVKEEEYVVMKAEADVVEEMMRKRGNLIRG